MGSGVVGVGGRARMGYLRTLSLSISLSPSLSLSRSRSRFRSRSLSRLRFIPPRTRCSPAASSFLFHLLALLLIFLHHHPPLSPISYFVLSPFSHHGRVASSHRTSWRHPRPPVLRSQSRALRRRHANEDYPATRQVCEPQWKTL